MYIASNFSNIDQVQRLAFMLEAWGYEITEKWWNRVYNVDGVEVLTSDLKVRYEELSKVDFYTREETFKSFLLDFKGIVSCDYFVYLASDEECKYNGASVEYGIALGLDKPVYLLGELEKSVMFTPLYLNKDYSFHTRQIKESLREFK